ncbi:diaminopimelate decarboxylase [Lederbergia citrea]|uniref:Diaminopimelate decarboxylase n=1 Tax=Lederbergia citrea TaxID=2833581 RepID=A0A942UP56_9BACI|nr:diaminopimelate decarboxylase [Lederbergia citrea]MBS4176459.1 diaminopimelate decarboxylase [Lederbergia citrea]MBS4203020.1 diaminopimelate decarboxylase [Lederbergia citrea]MBS4222308.1 diaminopimelate decarboxylase [Lederbergia citrea]
MHLYGTAEINKSGHLEIGGKDTIELVEKYGTPLYVYDVALIRKRARAFKQTFEKLGIKAQVAYASKAFSTIAMLQLIKEEGLSLDVVSGGELFTALKADFPVEKIHFHGNNKSEDELVMALEHRVGCIVVDNFHELHMLHHLCQERQQVVNILIRVTPGIEAHTHDYILTGQEDSKFGFDLQNGQAETALQLAVESKFLNVLGLHCHIGSQIFETTGFILAAKKILEKMAEWQTSLGFTPKVLNLGGGFGIRYTDEDTPLDPAHYVEEMIQEVRKATTRLSLPMPEIWIEPGRSLVADAGTTLYSIGSSKEVPNIRKYVAVDGGMTDNLRPALYDAKYEAILANRANEEPKDLVSIAGKCCESGDMLIWDLSLPDVGTNDILAVFCTGAYGYSMANNYNRIPRPPVVFVENGHDQLVVQRETYEDLLRLDLPFTEKTQHTS